LLDLLFHQISDNIDPALVILTQDGDGPLMLAVGEMFLDSRPAAPFSKNTFPW
jgi:hypothetical protein